MTTTFVREATTSQESLELDLKGFSFNQAVEFINSSFEDERPLSEMIRVTLVVGAGKEKRQKYDDDLPKWIQTTLRGLGYKEDHGGITSFDCCGTFKYQHDTGKNLKYVHVFPRATKKEDQVDDDHSELEADANEIPENISHSEWLCLVSPEEVFKKICSRRIVTWRQIMRCKQLFSEYSEKMLSIEQKLTNMKALDDTETKLYSEIVEIPEKTKILVSRMKNLVKDGKVTKEDKTELADKITAKINLAEGNDKLKNSLNEKLQQINEIQEKSLLEINNFKNTTRLKKLLRESLPLCSIESKAGSKGLWSSKLSPREVALLKHKQEVDVEITNLFEDERCYFETNPEFQARKDELVASVRGSIKQKSSAKKELGVNGGWGTVSVKKKTSPDFSKGLKKKPNTGAFNVLMD